jgi:hypothetical protein
MTKTPPATRGHQRRPEAYLRQAAVTGLGALLAAGFLGLFVWEWLQEMRATA